VTYGGPVTMDSGLINGLNVWNGANGNSTPTGSRYEVPTKLQPGKKYLLRFINGAIQSTYKIYLDQHEFTVIANDFVPIKPYTTNILNMSGGQRYEVIVEATSQSGGNFWLRADNQNACASTVQALDIKAIVRYEDAEDQLPTSTAYTYTGECVDEPAASLIPILPLNAGAADITTNDGAYDLLVQGNSAQLYKWYLSGTAFQSQPSDPILVDILNNNTIPDYSGNLLINTPNKGEWVYVIIESVVPLPHPIHLHGHDFFVLGQGTGSYTGSGLSLNNPPRRDTALMPGAGWIAVGFETDNPGVWLLHCHIGWHAAMGFALQFVEMQDQIKGSGAGNNSCALNDTCSKWKTWADAHGEALATDSGI
jgi:FtsP/CotA-like multicopper oxidase with cupredoxin domain